MEEKEQAILTRPTFDQYLARIGIFESNLTDKINKMFWNALYN